MTLDAILVGAPSSAVLQAWRGAVARVATVGAEHAADPRAALDAALAALSSPHVVVASADCIPIAGAAEFASLAARADALGVVGATQRVRGDVRNAGADAVLGTVLEHDGSAAILRTWNRVEGDAAPCACVAGPVVLVARERWRAVPFAAADADTLDALLLDWSARVAAAGGRVAVAARPLVLRLSVTDARVESLARLVARRLPSGVAEAGPLPRKAPGVVGALRGATPEQVLRALANL